MTRRGSCPARVLQLGGVTALITNLQQRCATTTKSSPMTFDTASFRKKATCTLLLGTKGHGVEPYLRTVLDSSAFSLHAPSTPILHQIHPRPRKSVDSQKLFTHAPQPLSVPNIEMHCWPLSSFFVACSTLRDCESLHANVSARNALGILAPPADDIRKPVPNAHVEHRNLYNFFITSLYNFFITSLAKHFFPFFFSRQNGPASAAKHLQN